MKKTSSRHKSEKEAWREKSIVEYAYLVKHIAARFAMRLPSSVFFDELVSAGSLGLIDAVDKFDPSKHVSLKNNKIVRFNLNKRSVSKFSITRKGYNNQHTDKSLHHEIG